MWEPLLFLVVYTYQKIVLWCFRFLKAAVVSLKVSASQVSIHCGGGSPACGGSDGTIHEFCVEKVEQFNWEVVASISVGGSFKAVLSPKSPCLTCLCSLWTSFSAGSYPNMARFLLWGKSCLNVNLPSSNMQFPISGNSISSWRTAMVKVEDYDYVLFASSANMTCFSCSETDYLFKMCRTQSDQLRLMTLTFTRRTRAIRIRNPTMQKCLKPYMKTKSMKRVNIKHYSPKKQQFHLSARRHIENKEESDFTDQEVF